MFCLRLRRRSARWRSSSPSRWTPVWGSASLPCAQTRPSSTLAYLFYLLQHSSVRGQLLQRSSGTTVSGIRQAELVQVQLDLPSVEAQRQVSAALGDLDDLIENNRRRIEILEQMARLLYREWFVHFRYPGHEDADLVDSELGSFPADWAAETLGSVAQWFSGGTPSTTAPEYWGGDVPWITSGSLKSFQLTDSDRRLTALGVENGSRLVPRDTTIFVVRGMSLAKEFRHGIADVPLAFGQDCKALIAKKGLDPLVLALGVSDMATQIQGMVEFAAHGTGKLSTDRLQSLRFIVPSQEAQRRFVEVARPMRDITSNLTQQNRVLREARDLLLPRLVSGELDVSELDLDGLLA